jgi:hypothetical protein
MALDFPSSPTNGQQYGVYTYDSTLGAWRSRSTSSAATYVSDTAPAAANNGDLWWNSTDGTFYVSYNDGNSTQWVEGRAPITANGYTSPNYIINGGFDVWQRGTSGTYASGSYSGADRWVCGSSSTTISKDADAPTGLLQSLKIVAASANSIYQRIEAANSTALAGKTVTLSFYYKRTSGTGNVDARFYYPSAADNFGTVTQIGSTSVISSSPASSWTRYSVSVALPPNVVNGLQVLINNDGNTTSYIAGVQLEEGTAATVFRRNANSIQGELAACQRYYWRSLPPTSNYQQLAMGFVTSGTSVDLYVSTPVPLRIPPTSIDYVAANLQVLDTGFAGSLTSLAVTSSSGVTPVVITATGSGYTTTRPAWLRVGPNTSGYIGFSAEL